MYEKDDGLAHFFIKKTYFYPSQVDPDQEETQEQKDYREEFFELLDQVICNVFKAIFKGEVVLVICAQSYEGLTI